MTVDQPAALRVCEDCGSAPADLPIVDDAGGFGGWLCEPCERKRRRKRMGWARRTSRRLRRWFQI